MKTEHFFVILLFTHSSFGTHSKNAPSSNGLERKLFIERGQTFQDTALIDPQNILAKDFRDKPGISLTFKEKLQLTPAIESGQKILQTQFFSRADAFDKDNVNKRTTHCWIITTPEQKPEIEKGTYEIEDIYLMRERIPNSVHINLDLMNGIFLRFKNGTSEYRMKCIAVGVLPRRMTPALIHRAFGEDRIEVHPTRPQ